MQSAIADRPPQWGATGLLEDALDRVAQPLAIVALPDRLLHANLEMRTLLDTGDILECEAGRLRAREGPAALALGMLLDDLANGSVNAMTAVSPDVALRAVRLDGGTADDPGPESGRPICLMVDDKRRLPPGAKEQSMRQFGLTEREAVVGLLLGSGQGLTDIARGLGVSRNTVRTHAATLRDKLGVSTSLAVAARLRYALSLRG